LPALLIDGMTVNKPGKVLCCMISLVFAGVECAEKPGKIKKTVVMCADTTDQ